MARLDDIRLHVGDSIGYFGPHDEALRGRRWDGKPQCWGGCQAGLSAIGIEADGTVKGCLSLQARWGDHDPFAEGNLKDRSLIEIWRSPTAFAYNRQHTKDKLTGPCARCVHAEQCRGGARCVSSAAIQSVTEDPYCWFLVSGELDEAVAHKRVPRSARDLLTTGFAARCLASMGALASIGGCGSDPQPGDTSDVELDDGVDVTDTAQDSTETTSDTPIDDSSQDVGPQDVDGVVDVADVADVDDVVDSLDAQDSDGGEVLDCSVVCCSCEYGILPEDVWKACCEICADVCCDCDYGTPPPPQCCP